MKSVIVTLCKELQTCHRPHTYLALKDLRFVLEQNTALHALKFLFVSAWDCLSCFLHGFLRVHWTRSWRMRWNWILTLARQIRRRGLGGRVFLCGLLRWCVLSTMRVPVYLVMRYRCVHLVLYTRVHKIWRLAMTDFIKKTNWIDNNVKGVLKKKLWFLAVHLWFCFKSTKYPTSITQNRKNSTHWIKALWIPEICRHNLTSRSSWWIRQRWRGDTEEWLTSCSLYRGKRSLNKRRKTLLRWISKDPVRNMFGRTSTPKETKL